MDHNDGRGRGASRKREEDASTSRPHGWKADEEPGDPIGSSLRVVVVDDHPLARVAICEALARSDEDYDVVAEADDGLAAVAATVEEHPDLVLLDYQMPRLNGIEAARCIKRLAPETRVILVTSYGHRELQMAADAAGVDGFVRKDELVRELDGTVQNLFTERTNGGETS